MRSGLDLDSTVVVGRQFFLNECCRSSHNEATRPGPTVIVQRGNFVIAGGRRPLEDLTRCCNPITETLLIAMNEM
jgi:hypothetical protein